MKVIAANFADRDGRVQADGCGTSRVISSCQRMLAATGFMLLTPLAWLVGAVIVALSAALAFGQEQDEPEPVIINLADRADLDVVALVQWMSETNRIQVHSEEDVLERANRRIRFFGFQDGRLEVSVDGLFHLMQAILRSNGLALVRSDVPDFYRVVSLPNVTPFAPRGRGEDFPPAEYATGVFKLRHIAPEQARDYLSNIVLPIGADGEKGAIISIIEEAKADLDSSLVQMADAKQPHPLQPSE